MTTVRIASAQPDERSLECARRGVPYEHPCEMYPEPHISSSHEEHHPPGGHDQRAGHSVAMFRQKFWGTLALSIPAIIWSPMIQHWSHYEAPGGPVASRWIPAIAGTAVFGYGGLVFIRSSIAEIRGRLPGMMTLISLAISVAFVFSLTVTLGFPGSDLWWELATLVTIMAVKIKPAFGC